MSNDITISNGFSLTPKTLEEAMKFAELIAKSSFVPKEYKDKTGDVFVAVQMGAELGLKPIQSLQNIAVINGKPSIWGDAALAIVQNHPSFESIDEKIEQGENLDDCKAICTVKRKGESAYTVTFSVADAKKAGLWGKQGPWTQYPKRMLQMRARGFALRDKFADALKGLITREEAMDYKTTIDVTNYNEKPIDLPLDLDPEKITKLHEELRKSKADEIADLLEQKKAS